MGLNQEHVSRYPYQLSGGQNQRVVLAMNPDLIIADEPTYSLDVSVQAQILNLITDMQKTFSHTYLFITHDFDVMRIMADQIAVMYLGRIVEIGETIDIFNSAKHPYTHALLSAATMEPAAGQRKQVILKGETPGLIDIPAGCRFHARFLLREEICMTKEPELVEVGRGHYLACHFV